MFDITANTDWCEENYQHSDWIAETFNTLSSIPIATFALYGAIHAWRNGYEKRQFWLLIGLFAAGCGSICFHATLTWQGQALDELPMIIGASMFLFSSLHLRETTVRWEVVTALIVYDATAFLLYFTHYYAVFIILYCIMSIPTMLVSLYHVRVSKVPVPWRTRSLGYFSVCIYIIGFVFFWLPERIMCGNRKFDSYVSVFQQLHFHAVWHLTTAFGTYFWSVYICLARLEWLRETNPAVFSRIYAVAIRLGFLQASMKPPRADDSNPPVIVTTASNAGLLSFGLPLPLAVIRPATADPSKRD